MRFFEKSYKRSQTILKIANSSVWILVFGFSLMVAIAGLIVLRNNESLGYVIIEVSVFGLYTSALMGNLEHILLSIRGFLGLGILYYLGICFFLFQWILTGNYKLNIMISLGVAAWLWIKYSMMANCRVACLANQVLSTLFGLIVILKDVVIALIPETALNKVMSNGYTMGKTIDMVWGLISAPFLAINLIALLLCSLKGYWIEKYNDGKDLEAPKPQEAQMPDKDPQNNNLQIRIKK